MEISEEFEDKMLLALIMNTDVSGEGIRRIVDNVKNSASLKEAETLVKLGVFFSRTIDYQYVKKLDYYSNADRQEFKKFIKEEDFRCKDNMFYLCNVNCIWFRWCFICEAPLCQLKDEWVDADVSEFAHKEEHEVIFGKQQES